MMLCGTWHGGIPLGHLFSPHGLEQVPPCLEGRLLTSALPAPVQPNPITEALPARWNLPHHARARDPPAQALAPTPMPGTYLCSCLEPPMPTLISLGLCSKAPLPGSLSELQHPREPHIRSILTSSPLQTASCQVRGQVLYF